MGIVIIAIIMTDQKVLFFSGFRALLGKVSSSLRVSGRRVPRSCLR